VARHRAGRGRVDRRHDRRSRALPKPGGVLHRSVLPRGRGDGALRAGRAGPPARPPAAALAPNKNRPGATPGTVEISPGGKNAWLGRFDLFARIAQHVAAAPDGFDVVLAAASARELLAQLADEHVDDLEFRLVHSAVEMVEEHFLGQRGAL